MNESMYIDKNGEIFRATDPFGLGAEARAEKLKDGEDAGAPVFVSMELFDHDDIFIFAGFIGANSDVAFSILSKFLLKMIRCRPDGNFKLMTRHEISAGLRNGDEKRSIVDCSRHCAECKSADECEEWDAVKHRINGLLRAGFISEVDGLYDTYEINEFSKNGCRFYRL